MSFLQEIAPFAGVSLGILGMARQGSGNLEYDAVWGVGVLAGFEQSLGGTAKLFAKVEYARGLQQIPARTISGVEFAGGTLAWLHITFGSRFSF